MAKKSDILSLYYNDFPEFNKSYQTRLKSLEREFFDVKNFQKETIQNAIQEYEKIETDLRNDFLHIEKTHFYKKLEIEDEYKGRFAFLDEEIKAHSTYIEEYFDAENRKFQDILNQFEDRKSEAFDTYLRLSREANYAIEKETKIHKDFISEESRKLDNIKFAYQKLNSDLANQLLWTMEKAKNALEKLDSALKDKTENDIEFMNETIIDSLDHLRSSHNKLSTLFYNSTHDLEKERDRIREISKNKRKPHSDLNQEMIMDFVKKIRDVNQNRVSFVQMINRELRASLDLLHPKIIKADMDNDEENLSKFILQKEIIEKKAKYLLNRNKTISDLLISKYQNEIKKNKIDSFKRYEEIKLAYEMPSSFFQNSVNIYSNFNFYLSETFNDLDNILMDLIKYNQNYIEIKTNYITGSSKIVEDYKINLMVRVNELTSKLTNYITSIDEVSHKLVTLESNNRLEIAEIRKKMENVEIQGDLHKYLASLENDQYIAMFQHNKNIEKIQIEANYKSELLNINSEVLLLNKNRQDLGEYKNYLLEVCKLENKIQATTYEKRIAEANVYYEQQKYLIDVTMRLIKNKLSYNVKKENYGYAEKYNQYLDYEDQKNAAGSNHIVNFVHEMQNLIDLNISQTNKIEKYISASKDDNAYIHSLERTRNKIIDEVSAQTSKKTDICHQAIKLYSEENQNLYNKTVKIFEKYRVMLKQLILLNESQDTVDKDYIINTNGYLSEIVSAFKFIHKLTIEYAYKYQFPAIIKYLARNYESYLNSFVVLNVKQIHLITKTKKPNKIMIALKKYYIETLNLFEKYQLAIDKSFQNIKAKVIKNDQLFIKKANKHDLKIKNIINLEYDKLIAVASKKSVDKEKQLMQLQTDANNLNDVFKSHVQQINEEFLKNRKDSKQVSEYIKKEFSKIVAKNDKELMKILKFTDKLYIQDAVNLDKQYKAYLKTFNHIDVKQKSDFDDEINYINQLYDSRMNEATETIAILEKRIDMLPVKKQDAYALITKEKQGLLTTKNNELMKRYAEIEKEKFVSRPAYLKQIDLISKRLPNDYLALYKSIQNLEDDFIKQYSDINLDYQENYQNFLKSQSEYKDVITKHALVYKPFEDIKKYHEKVLTTTDVLYKDTISKSKEARDDMNKAKQKSKEKQKRIINA